jgi:peroxiredoxin
VLGHAAELQALGGRLVAVTMSRPEVLAAFLRRRPWPCPVVADPDLTVYRALGLGRASWASLLRPSVLGLYLKLIVRGGPLRRPPKGEDVHQLGGDFVLDRQRRLVYAYRSADPSDRPAAGELVRAVRDAVSGPPARD